MLPHDPTGKSGPKKPLPDQVSTRIYNSHEPIFILQVSVVEPKDEVKIKDPYSEQKGNAKASFDAVQQQL